MSEPTHKYRAGSALDDESQEEYGHGKMPLIQKAEKVPTAPGSKSIPKKKSVKKGDKKPKKSPGSSIISLGPLTSASPYNKSITQMYKNLEALRRNTTSSSASKINNSISLSNNNNSDTKDEDTFLPYLAPATAPKPPGKMNLDLKTNMSHFMNAASSLAEPSVEASNGFVVASGMVGEEPRMVSYQIREILGVCFSVDFVVESTGQTWMVFVPTTEILAELLRLIRLRRKIDDMRTLCSWILTCIVLDFDDMRIVSARFDAKQLQDVVSSTLTKMVHHYAIKMQSLVRRFLSNVRLAKVWATKKQIKKSQQEAMKRARERLAQFQAMHQSMAIGNLNNSTGPASPGSRGSRLFPASMNGNRMARHRQSELVSFSPFQQMRSHGDNTSNNTANLKLSPNKRGMAAIPEQRHNVSGSTNTASSSGRKASRSDAPSVGHTAPTTNTLVNMRRPSNALGLHMNAVAGNGGPTSNYSSAISEYGGGKTEQQLRLLRRELTGQMTFFEDELMQIKSELEEQKLTLFYSRGAEYKAALKYNPNDDDELGQSGESPQGSRQNRMHAFKDAPNGTYERDSSGNNGGANNNNNNNNNNNVVQISPAELEQLKSKFSQLEMELKEQKHHVEEVARRETEDFSTLQQQQDLKVKEAADRVAKEQMALLEEELQQKEAQISELEKKLSHVMVEQVKAQSNVMKRQEALIEKERTELLEKQELMKKELAELVQQLHTKQVEQQQTMAQAQEKWTQQQQQQQQSLQLQISKQKELIAQMTTQLNEVAMRPVPPVGGRSGRNQGGNNNNSVRKGRFLKSSSSQNNNNAGNNPSASTGNLHANNEESIENVPPAGMWSWLSRNLGMGRGNSNAGNKSNNANNNNRRGTSVPSSSKAGSGPAGSFSSPVDGTTTPVESAVNNGPGGGPLVRRQSFLGETRRSMQMLTGSMLGSFSVINNDDANNNNINSSNNVSDSPVAHSEEDMMGGFLKFLKPLEDLTRVKEEEHEDEGISEGGRGHSAGRSAEEEEFERQKQLEEELRQEAAEKIQHHFRGYAQRIGLSRWPNYYLEYQQALNPHVSIPGANRYNNNKFVKVDVNTPAVEGSKLLPDKKEAFFKARNEVHIPYSLRKTVFQQGNSTSNPAIINRALYFAVRGLQAMEKSLSEGNKHAADANDKRNMGLTKQDIDMMNRLMMMSTPENEDATSSKGNQDMFASVSGEELAGLSNLRTLTLFIESILQAAENFVVELNNPLEDINIHRIFHVISTASYLAEIMWLEEQDLQGVLPTSLPVMLEAKNTDVNVPEPTSPSKSNTKSNIVSVIVTAATAGKNVHYNTTSAFAKPRLLRERSKITPHPPTIAEQLTLLRRQQRKKIPGYNPTEENQDPEEDIMIYFPSTASPNASLDRKASSSFKMDLPEIFRLKRIVIRGLYFLHQVVKSQPKFWDHCGLSKTGFKAYKKEILAWQQHLQSSTADAPSSPSRTVSVSEVTNSGVGGPFMQEVYTFFLSLSRAISGSVRYWSMFAEVQICGHAFRSLYLILCCSIPSLYRPMLVNEELILGLRRCLEHFQMKGNSPGLIASTTGQQQDNLSSGNNHTAVSPTSVSGEHSSPHKYKMDIAHPPGHIPQVHFVLQKSDALEYILKAMVNLCINNRASQDLLGRFQVPACLLMSLLNLHEDHNPQTRLRNTTLMVLHCRGLINLCAMDHRGNQSMLGKGMLPTIYVKMLLIHAAKIYAIENSLYNNHNNSNNNKASLLPITENETDRTEYTLVEQLLRAIVAMALNHEENKLKLQNAGICEVILDLLQALTTGRRHDKTHNTPTTDDTSVSSHFYREARQSLVTSLLWALTHLTMASSAYCTIHQRVLQALSALQQSLSVTDHAGDQVTAQEVQKAFQRLNEFTPSSPVQTASPLSSSALRRNRQLKPPSTAIPATSSPKTPFTTKI